MNRGAEPAAYNLEQGFKVKEIVEFCCRGRYSKKKFCEIMKN